MVSRNYQIPTVFITGIRGFTANHLRKALLDLDYKVHGLVRDKPVSNFEHQANLLDAEALTIILKKIKPDYIFHLAAISFVPHENPNDLYQNNLFGTLSLLNAIKKADFNPRKILIASSANIYGNPITIPIPENACPFPLNHYANSKLAMEYMVKLWFPSFPIVITRPFNYTGTGQATHFLVPKIIEHFRNKSSFIKLGNLEVVRDISNIQLIVKSYLALMQHSVHSEIFNICSGVGYSVKEILQKMEIISGYAINVEIDPDLVREPDIKILIGSNEKLNNIIGQIEAPSLDETLIEIYNSNSKH